MYLLKEHKKMEVIEFFKGIDARISRAYVNSNILTLWFESEKAHEFSEFFDGINDVFECQLIGGDLCIDVNINDTEKLFGESLTEDDFTELQQY